MQRKKVKFTHKLQYAFDNFLSRGSAVLIPWLGILTLFFVSVLGFILILIGIHPEDGKNLSFLDSLWINFIHLIDPGSLGENEANWGFRLFMFIVTIIGVVVTSTLIALISNSLLTKLDELRKGRSYVLEKNHTLILGWNSKIFTIISELVIANENQKHPAIVILADKDKVEMEDEIRSKVGDTKNTRLICRTGNPIDVQELYIANPYDTKSIIILGNEDQNSDSQIIKTIVAIVTNPERRKEPYHITAEIQNQKNYEVAKMVGKDEVELILSDEIISKIMVQTSRQSGLSVVYIELMDFGGDEIYFAEEPKILGRPFRDVLFMYEDSSIIGIQYPNGKVKLNPPMDTQMTQGIKIIGITEDDDTLVPTIDNRYKVARKRIVLPQDSTKRPEKILMLGWNERASHIISEINNYAPKGSKLTVVSKFEESRLVLDQLTPKLNQLSVGFQVSDTTDRDVLEKLKIDQFDYIIILCYQAYYNLQEADAQTLITLLHIRNMAEKNKQHYNIVSEMLDMRNRQLADITNADDFIVSDKLTSLLMSQVAENKFLMRVFEDLFDAGGSEIYIKPASEYVTVHKPINFYTLLDAAADRNEVAIGYRIMKYSKDNSKNYGVVLNPKKSDLFDLTEEDRIIVLSEN